MKGTTAVGRKEVGAMKVGQVVEMLRPEETNVPPGTRGRIIEFALPSGRAVIEWDTGVLSLMPGTDDEVLVLGASRLGLT
jgi:hypothetical protein